MRSAGGEVIALRSSCQNSGNISLVRIGCHRKNSAQPRAEAEQAPQLSRRICPWGDPQARAVRGAAVYHCQCRRCDVFGEIHKSTPGSKTGRRQTTALFSGLRRSCTGLFIYFFFQPSICFCWVSSIFCIVLSPNIHNHADNHKLTCFSTGTATVIVKEICTNEQATSAYSDMFNVFDNSCRLGHLYLDIRTGQLQ